MRKRWFLVVPLAAALLRCASAPPAGWEQVRVIEKNEEGMEHLALPKHLEGCEYLGGVRSEAPLASSSGALVSEDLLDQLKQKAARKGGDTLALLPGKRMQSGSLRGSVFRCGKQP
jgi:hypothetical protein